MIAALIESGKLARATEGARGHCPECKGSVYARFPENAIKHWAHTPLPDGQERDCSRGKEMTEWHYSWQSERTDLSCIEVTVGSHRADLINAGGAVIEFQHSTITPEDVKAREQHWEKGVWVLDGTPAEGKERVRLRRHPDQEPDDPYRAFQWPRANLVLYRAKWPVWIDVGDGCLQVRFAKQGGGGGWLVAKEWFINEVINGPRTTLRPHLTPKAPAAEGRKRIGRASEETQEDLAEIPVHCTRPMPDEPCCGQHYPGVEGEPIVLACQLCPASPIYWRKDN